MSIKTHLISGRAAAAIHDYDGPAQRAPRPKVTGDLSSSPILHVHQNSLLDLGESGRGNALTDGFEVVVGCVELHASVLREF